VDIDNFYNFATFLSHQILLDPRGGAEERGECASGYAIMCLLESAISMPLSRSGHRLRAGG